MTYLCPWCGSKLGWRARIDSDDRIESKWRACERGVCTYDERKDGPPVYQAAITTPDAAPDREKS